MMNRIFFKGDIKNVCKHLNMLCRHNKGITLGEYIVLLTNEKNRRNTILNKLYNFEKGER